MEVTENMTVGRLSRTCGVLATLAWQSCVGSATRFGFRVHIDAVELRWYRDAVRQGRLAEEDHETLQRGLYQTERRLLKTLSGPSDAA